jgi:uncharacterized membrane protein (DUF4010 family)
VSPQAVEILMSIGVALAAGFIVGAEREQGGNASFGGVRTFPLIALLGAIGMLLGWWGLALVGVMIGALLAISYYRDSQRADGVGLSTEIAALVTFGLGALCTARDIGLGLHDRLLLVAAGATVTLALLTVKQPLHRVIRKLTAEEVLATTKLLILAVIVLPLLPDRSTGPWGVLNPRSIGLLAVLISAIGFAGYAAIRIFGTRRGLVLTGLLGGLASSTAVTLSFAGRARANSALTLGCAVAIALASATMFPRILVEVAAVSPRLATAALWPFLAIGAVSLAASALLYRRLAHGDRGHEPHSGGKGNRDAENDRDAEGASKGNGELELGNPFSVWSALKFAALFVVILLISNGASRYFADTGIYVSAAVAGLADVDAISLSIAQMHQHNSIAEPTALTGLAITAASNTLTKIGIAAVLGSRALAARVALVLLPGLAAGGATLLIMQAV